MEDDGIVDRYSLFRTLPFRDIWLAGQKYEAVRT